MALELDPALMAMLACPSDDHAPLRAGTPSDPTAAVLTCTSCGRGYPVVGGVPVLLLDEAISAPVGGQAMSVPAGGPAVSPAATGGS